MGSIPSVYSTGINDFYNPLQTGSLDFHYVVSPPPFLIGSTQNAMVTDTSSTNWMQPWDSARWISTNLNPTMTDTTYYFAFNLDRFDSNSAVITGEISASGNSTLLLNGNSTGVTYTGDGTNKTPFSLSGPFLPGINRLSFSVASTGGKNGLLVSMSGTANPVPEPSGLIAMTIGLLAAAFAVKWKKMKAALA